MAPFQWQSCYADVHSLKGDLRGLWRISIPGSWRVAGHACAETWRNTRDDLKGIQLAQLVGSNGTIWQVTEPRSSASNRLKSIPPRTRREQRDGAAQGNSLHAHGAAQRRIRVRQAATIAGRSNCAPPSVADISRGADATLVETV